ncbi:OmpA family protein [Halocola ammonii]
MQKRLCQIAFFISLLCLASLALGQAESTSIKKIEVPKVDQDLMATGIFQNQLILSIAEKENLINTIDRQAQKTYSLHLAEFGEKAGQLESPKKLSGKLDGFYDDGSASYSPKDSVIFFSSANGYFSGSSKTLNIFYSYFENGKWSQPYSFPWNSDNYHLAHPVMSETGDQLFFSSNMPGGEGEMDIYVSLKSDTGWTKPINLGPGVNSKHNEIFPSWWGDQLYFSSNRPGGIGQLDLYSASRSDQWKSVSHLDEPFNSEKDDFLLIYQYEDQGFLTSNRTGKDALYFFEKSSAEQNGVVRHGLFECQGTPVRNAAIVLRNTRNEVVLRTRTDSLGRFKMTGIGEKEQFSIELDSGSPEIDRCAVLFLTDENGRKKQRIVQNEDGLFIFEILPNDEIPPMAMKENEDESILKIDLEGKVVDESGEEVEEGEPIYILDDNGELMALAYTTDFGNFKFSEISPNATYKLKMNEDDRSLSLVIYDGDEEITVPMNDKNEAVYERASENDGIEIVDESNKKVNIRNDEKFVVDNIYYATDEYRLNVISMRELNRWVTILKKNPNVKIELTSHTDSRGVDEYNMKLSDRRAQEAKKYLVEKGVPENRIIAKGMGESELLNDCDDESDCDEDQHAINRRTEIRIFAAEK